VSSPHGAVLSDEEFITGRRFWRGMDSMRTPREMAIQWAEQQRIAIEAYDLEVS
jgi:hypothetical protein